MISFLRRKFGYWTIQYIDDGAGRHNVTLFDSMLKSHTENYMQLMNYSNARYRFNHQSFISHYELIRIPGEWRK